MSLQLEQAQGGNFVLAKAGVTIGTTTSTVKTAATIPYTIDGVYAASKAATDNISLTAQLVAGYALTPIPIGSKASFGLWIDGSGVFGITQGAISAVNLSSEKVSPPPNPGSRALVAVFTVYVGAAAAGAFTPGTTALSATGMTAAYNDMLSLPSGGF